jgi:2-oxo-3-hexenedioate decarboxylase
VDDTDVAGYAAEMVRLQDETGLGPPISERRPDFTLTEAYQVARRLLATREQSGWRRVGCKLGFTNRTIHAEYGVYAPVFGYMYDRTVSQAQEREGRWTATLSLKGLVQPRIEPEIAFKLRRPPPINADAEALLGSVEWLAHGFEVVQCHFPEWRFSASDTVADGGLHGRYIVGPAVSIDADAEALAKALQTFRVSLQKDGSTVAEGGGELVLGSPLNALGHLVALLETLPEHPPLEAGELITTGTLTAALPVAPGETWSTRIEGLDLPGLSVAFE